MNNASTDVFIIHIPNEIIDIVFSYLPAPLRMGLSRKYYVENHSSVQRRRIRKASYENYVRAMIQRDCDFVFQLIMQENYKRWVRIKKYAYKNAVFANYLYFLRDFCWENDAVKCRKTMNVFLDEMGIRPQNMCYKDKIRSDSEVF